MKKLDNVICIFLRALLFALLLLLVCYIFRSEISFSGFPRYVNSSRFLYVIIGIIGCWWLLRIEEKKRFKIALLGLTSFLSLVFTESILTITDHIKNPPSIEKLRSVAALQQGKTWDKRSKIQIIRDLKRDGVKVVPSFHSSSVLRNEQFSKLLPLGGISNEKTVYDRESGEYIIYQSDRFGFRNPDTEWDVSKVELMLIGDSFVHGCGVDDGQDLAGHLRGITNNNVINLGIGGNGPLAEYATLIEYGERVSANTILWIYYEGNDLNNLFIEGENYILKKYFDGDFSQNLVYRQNEIDNLLISFIQFKLDNYKEEKGFNASIGIAKNIIYLRNIRKNSRLLYDKYLGSESNDTTNKIAAFSKILSKAKIEASELGGKIVFVYLPCFHRYDARATKKSEWEKAKFDDQNHDQFMNKSELIQIVSNLEIPVIDIHKEVFSMHPDPLSLFPFEMMGHYNAKGYKEVAEAIAEFLDN